MIESLRGRKFDGEERKSAAKKTKFLSYVYNVILAAKDEK